MKFRVTIHRIVAWWLAAFAFMTIFAGYAHTRDWAENSERWINIHIIFKWAMFLLLLFHITYTFLYTRMSKTIVKQPKKHWLRLLQHITKWLILAFVLLTLISGFSYYNWTRGALPEWLLEKIHTTFDIGLTLSILAHVLIGFKLMLKRKKINVVWVNIFLIVVGMGLLAFYIYLEATPPAH
ncbi:MAG: hypothetical protein ACTSXO_13245 [Candidatus Heimdallarchaeota archaeon]